MRVIKCSMCPYFPPQSEWNPSGVFCLSRSYCPRVSGSVCMWWLGLTNMCDVSCAQLWLGDSQSGSRAPAPSCLAGRTRPCSGGWLRGGRRWAGSRRRWTCSRSGPTLGRSHRSSSASQVSRAGRERKIEFICLTSFCGLMFWSLKGRLDCLCVRIIQRRWLCVCVYKAVCYSFNHRPPLSSSVTFQRSSVGFKGSISRNTLSILVFSGVFNHLKNRCSGHLRMSLSVCTHRESESLFSACRVSTASAALMIHLIHTDCDASFPST